MFNLFRKSKRTKMPRPYTGEEQIQLSRDMEDFMDKTEVNNKGKVVWKKNGKLVVLKK